MSSSLNSPRNSDGNIERVIGAKLDTQTANIIEKKVNEYIIIAKERITNQNIQKGLQIKTDDNNDNTNNCCSIL